MNRRRLYALGAAAAAACAFVAAAPSLARRDAVNRAAAMGLRLVIRKTRLGWGTVRFHGVTMASREVPGVTVSLDDVIVTPSLALSPRSVEVHGGHVRVNGSNEAIAKQLEGWRDAHTNATTVGREHRDLRIAVDGVDLSWTGAAGKPAEFAWGIRYSRAPDGRERLAADLARLSFGRIDVEASRGDVDLERDGERRVLVGLAAARLDASVDLDASDAGRDLAREGTAEPATENPGSRLRADLERVATRISSWLRPSSKVELRGAHITIRHDGDSLNVGPATLMLSSDAGGTRIGLTSGADDGKVPLHVEASVPSGAGPIDIALGGGPLSLRALGVKEGDMGLEDVERSDVEANGRATLTSDGRTLHIEGRSRFSGLAIDQPRLAGDPVRGLELSLSGGADVSLDGNHVRVDDVQIGVGKVKLGATGELFREDGYSHGTIHAEIPLAACSDMLASIPPSLVPLLGGLEVSGTFAFSGGLTFDTRRPGDAQVDLSAANDCRITKVPAAISADRFSRPWERTVLGPGDVPTTIESGPGTRDWVPLTEISPYVPIAVVVCEDSNFWVHHGFNEKSIRDSIRDNLRAGKFLRGASTVSMQLAKNLYLGREKTLSRKLQESVLTVLLEQSLTKERILELYLNVIEFAPGLYGIGPAAEHYFNSLPKDLSLAQAFYLVSILPNPKIRHFAPDGTLSKLWADYLRHLMDIAHKIRKVDDRELAAGIAETVHLGVPGAEDGEPESGSAEPDVPDLAPDAPEPDTEGP